ncbi:beta-N-acetylhexosaminidase [Croceiramulus getboli]|nr:family 20 glycosylhydrolase [Flavobacteriaceae bacterium YJPT1-3]
MRVLVLFLCLGVCVHGLIAAQESRTSLIPLPQSVEYGSGSFELPETLSVYIQDFDTETLEAAMLLEIPFIEKLQLVNKEEARLHLIKSTSTSFLEAPERYSLLVTSRRITIKSASATGVFYGMQTFRQLCAFAKASQRKAQPSQTPNGDSSSFVHSIPEIYIDDQPRYPWRGSMLDLARRFMDVAYIKKHIDRMSTYKLNRLHLHLTDDQGWRIEMKNYPRLTSVGSKSAVGDGKEGFLTQEEYKELQQYALQRGIMIIPEIDMPGHIYAALRAYPELLNCEDTSNIDPKRALPPNPYRGMRVGWSKFCLARPETYEFVETVINELSAITQGPYIHIGGDEIEDERYTEFIKRAERMVSNTGKTMIGWEEIAKAELEQETVVQLWRGDVTIQPAQPQIYSLCKHLYLDHANYPGEARTNNWCKPDGVHLSDVYAMDLAEGKSILGIEAPLWTEFVDQGAKADRMLWPRLIAVAERAWTPEQDCLFVEFRRRLNAQEIYFPLSLELSKE